MHLPHRHQEATLAGQQRGGRGAEAAGSSSGQTRSSQEAPRNQHCVREKPPCILNHVPAHLKRLPIILAPSLLTQQ